MIRCTEDEDSPTGVRARTFKDTDTGLELRVSQPPKMEGGKLVWGIPWTCWPNNHRAYTAHTMAMALLMIEATRTMVGWLPSVGCAHPLQDKA